MFKMNFAHLAGIGRARAAVDDTTDDKAKGKAKADDDEVEPKEQTRENGDAKARAEDDKQNPNLEGDDDSGYDNDGNPKKMEDESDKDFAARCEEFDKDDKTAEDEDGSEQMRGNSPAAKARLCEQRRCAAIFSHPAAAKNPVLAANLAFTTRLPRNEAMSILAATPAPPLTGNRSAGNPRIGAALPPNVSSVKATQDRWDAGLRKAAGSRLRTK